MRSQGERGCRAVPSRRARRRHAVARTRRRSRPRTKDEGPAPEDRVRLRAEAAARAIVRFVERESDLVTGGTIADWPLARAAQAAPANLRIDPAAGLFGLAVVRRDGFLADPGNRAAVAQAFDRAALAAAISPDWTTRETLLPEQLNSATPAVSPAWQALSMAQRRAAATATVARWRAANGVPTLGLALPRGPGGTLLWGRLARDLYAIGVRPVRLAPDDPDADLRLVDRVAPYDSALVSGGGVPRLFARRRGGDRGGARRQHARRSRAGDRGGGCRADRGQ
ncbi:hypothetical protein AB5I41_29355 [Sphingomonas sp. MMS24-JH45]